MAKRLTDAALAKLEDAARSVRAKDADSERERDACERDGIEFAKRFFRARTGGDMIVGPHHRAIQNAIQKVIDGEITRLIINVPPGYSKTELATINAIARGLAINPRARFLHLSYSHNLALQNSSSARRVIKFGEFQQFWPMAMRDDSDAKGMWWTDQNGGVYASSSAGQVTGFRAGHMEPGWQGALIIDDPVKPADAYSEVVRTSINENFNDTIKSRLALETTPIIVIMQRIHYHDLSGYLLRGGSGEKWHHLNLPVLIENSKKYPEENTHGIPIEHGLTDGWLWPYKHREEHRAALMAHRRTFEAQYMQEPRRFNAEGALWSETLIAASRALNVGSIKRIVVGVDPAVSNNTDSDETGIIVAAAHDGDKYSLRGDYSGKYSPDGWAKSAIKAVNDHGADAIVIETNQGGDMAEHVLRLAGYKGRIIRVHASKGKFARAEPVAALYEQGKVSHCGDLYTLENQMMEYVPKDAIKSPDRLDAAVWALSELAPLGKATGGVLF